jgi:hypothetical protein
MNNLPEHGIPLPPLSDDAAFEILEFLTAIFQIFETRYADQIYRYYHTNNIIRSPPSTTNQDEPF